MAADGKLTLVTARPDEAAFDVVILSAGAGGMAAALFCALRGLRAAVVEKAAVVGGTTALSAGTSWIPGTVHASEVGAEDSADRVHSYLRAALGPLLDEAKLDAFLAHGPAAIAELAARTEVKFRARPHHPDYMSELDGAVLKGRALEPLPLDGRRLGADLALLRPPLPELTLLGMMLGADDLRHMLRATRSPRSALHALRLLARHAVDRLRHPRGTRLLLGNALCGRLLLSLRLLGVPVWTQARATGLLGDGARVEGVEVERGGHRTRVTAHRAVILATGGFAHSPELRPRLLPPPLPAHTAVPPEVSGDGMRMALERGAALGESHGNGSFWAPVSVHPRRDGSIAVYPHFFLDRGKPGVIAVDGSGRRFVNEATSYNRFVRGMYEAHAVTPAIPCHLIADSPALRAYGFGMVLPGGWRLRRLLAEGYVRRAETLNDLARQLGIDPAALMETVERFNRHARLGEDPDFARGATTSNHVLGDSAHRPNPCLGPLERGPFYALALHPGINGTHAGLRTDVTGRVLRADGAAFENLYACGNDMSSLMADRYPGPGITIGPAIAFAHAIAEDLAVHQNP